MKLDEFIDEEQTSDRHGVNPFYLSFSDLMMLLSVFFVLIISVSKVETGLFEQIKIGFSGETKGTLVELAEELRVMIEEDPGIPNVKIEYTKEGVRLDLKTAALFSTGSHVLMTDALAPMDILIEKIKKTDYFIDIEGHSDDRYFYKKNEETIETNWSLSGMRAASVLHYILRFNLKESRLRLVGYSSNRPKISVENKTGKKLEQARAENRRVSLLIR
jgi:chemotaxis protein MotB